MKFLNEESHSKLLSCPAILELRISPSLGLIATMLLIVIAGAGIALYRRKKKASRSNPPLNERGDVRPASIDPSPLIQGRSKSMGVPTTVPGIDKQEPTLEKDIGGRLDRIASDTTSPEIKQFMGDIAGRINEEQGKLGDNVPIALIEELVDRIDDLGLIRKNATADDAGKINQFIAVLTTMLESAGVELVHSATWNPEVQRAISKTPTDGIVSPMITSFGSTGIRHHLKLIRKQEVLLAVPSQPTT